MEICNRTIRSNPGGILVKARPFDLGMELINLAEDYEPYIEYDGLCCCINYMVLSNRYKQLEISEIQSRMCLIPSKMILAQHPH